MAIAVRAPIKGREFNAQVHPSLLQKWQQSWMCNRCGEIFVV